MAAKQLNLIVNQRYKYYLFADSVFRNRLEKFQYLKHTIFHRVARPVQAAPVANAVLCSADAYSANSASMFNVENISPDPCSAVFFSAV